MWILELPDEDSKLDGGPADRLRSGVVAVAEAGDAHPTGADVVTVADDARLGRAADAAVVVAVTVAAFVLRRRGLPNDGLWYDDAWVAGGAVWGSVGDVARTAGAHPGFTLLLRIQNDVLGGRVERLALPAFVFGVVGPAVVYLALRVLRYERVGGLLAAVGVMVTPAHVVYSGRVKPYTLDVVGVMVLVAALPWLARRRWTWWFAAGWVAFAVGLGSFSGYLMLASALAMVLLVVHANDDRGRRLVALGVQGLIQAGWVLNARRFVDMDEIERFMEGSYDAHVERSRNPFELASNVFGHLERVVEVHPGGPSTLLGVLAVAVVVGLVLGAVGRLDPPRTLVSQFSLLALSVAAVGGVLDRLPFGPSNHDLSTALGAPGARHGLWLVPITAIGLCNGVDLLARGLAGRRMALTAFRCVVAAVAILLAVNRWDPVTSAGEGGARHFASLTDQAADDGAFIVLDQSAAFQYLLLTDRPVDLAWVPEEMVGYLPSPVPSEGAVLGPVFTEADLTEFLASNRHDELVLVGFDLPYDQVMTREGWKLTRTEARGGYRVAVWERQ